MEKDMAGSDLSVPGGDQLPPRPIKQRDLRMWDFDAVDPNRSANFDPLARDRHDRLDQRSISGSAKSATEITAGARLLNDSRARQAHEHHISNIRRPVNRYDPPQTERFAWRRVDTKLDHDTREGGQQN